MIYLAEKAQAALARAVEAAFPQEGCGLLIGHWRNEDCRIERIAESANLAEQPNRNFEIDPQLQFSLQRDLRHGPTRVVGVYHSHPYTAPVPSEKDQARALDRDLVWLIAGLQAGKFGLLRAYAPGGPGEDFVEIDLRTES
jgi:proteasome lid subunit RPN8/RPN11